MIFLQFLKNMLKTAKPFLPKYIKKLKTELPEGEAKLASYFKERSPEDSDFSIILFQNQGRILAAPVFIDNENRLSESQIKGQSIFHLRKLIEKQLENPDEFLTKMINTFENEIKQS